MKVSDYLGIIALKMCLGKKVFFLYDFLLVKEVFHSLIIPPRSSVDS